MNAAPAAIRDDGADRRWLVVAMVCGGVLPLASPFTGELRASLRAWSPASFRLIVTSAVVVVIAGLVAASARRLWRERAGWRGGLGLAAAVASATAYVAITATGNGEVDAVERVHLVEYGLVAWLFFHAWRRVPGWGSLLLTAAASMIVAAADEIVQWLVPFRVGEIRDVWLDGVAIAAGLLVAVSVRPPARWSEPMSRRARRTVGVVLSAAIVALATVLQVAHLGVRIDEQIGRAHV